MVSCGLYVESACKHWQEGERQKLIELIAIGLVDQNENLMSAATFLYLIFEMQCTFYIYVRIY